MAGLFVFLSFIFPLRLLEALCGKNKAVENMCDNFLKTLQLQWEKHASGSHLKEMSFA